MYFFFNDTATTEIYTLSLHDALPICLAARYRPDVVGVADDQGEGALQGGVDGLPVDAGPLHPDVRDPLLEQPGAQGREVLAHGAEAAHLRQIGRASCRERV